MWTKPDFNKKSHRSGVYWKRRIYWFEKERSYWNGTLVFYPTPFKSFLPPHINRKSFESLTIRKRMFVLGKMMVCLDIDLRWRFLYLPFSSVFWDYLRRKSYLEKWHWTISKNCTQLFFDLNRLKFSVGEVWYILKEIKICAGRILIGSKDWTHWLLSSKIEIW